MAAKKPNLKFTDKYQVETATIYKASEETESIRIPPPSHPLYDPTAPTTFDTLRVEAIDRSGTMTDPIEVWTDPDTSTLWVLDGRQRWLDVLEVNRRRQKSKREPVKPYLVPFHGDEKAAVARVFEKNFHRRVPTTSATAVALQRLRQAGHAWDACAAALHVETEDPEQWGRKLLPLAWCIAEVREAIDAGEIPKSMAVQFGGSAPDGSKRLGNKEQMARLEQLRADKQKERVVQVAPVGPKARDRVRAALGNGATKQMDAEEREVARIVNATLARIAGDAAALKEWPQVAEVVEAALKPLPKGPKPKAAN